MLAVGFSESVIKVWSLLPSKLRTMKTAEELQDIDREAGNISTPFFVKLPQYTLSEFQMMLCFE